MEDPEAKLAIEELRGNQHGGTVGEDELLRVGAVFAERGRGRECAPDGRLDVSRKERGFERRSGPNGDPAEGKAKDERQKEGSAGP